jgi:hypothetical protein
MGLATPLAGLLFDVWGGGAFWGACLLSLAGALVLTSVVVGRAERSVPA